MAELTETPSALPPAAPAGADKPYDRRKLSYAGTFANPWKSQLIRAMELFTGKIRLVRLIRRIEKGGIAHGQPFFPMALRAMGIQIRTPVAEIARIPKTGPVIVVANHPHGLVDGMVLADMIGHVRTDYKILTRSLLTEVPPIQQFMIPVPFPHEEDAVRKSLQMREEAMAHLAAGGVVVLFPSGSVASAKTLFGPAIEAEWNPFTAKMIQKSGATVVPVHFTGQNSRWYQIAAQISPTLRQGLLLHEVVHSLNRPQRPVIGQPLSQQELEPMYAKPREFMAWLREKTLSLTET